MDVEEEGTRGVGRVGCMKPAGGQMPQQKSVDRPEGELARFCGAARALDIVEQPSKLGA